MAYTNGSNLESFYQHVQKAGQLRTPAHARRWSTAVLNTLGLTLSRSARRQLANALPAELAAPLKRVFWLLHFRDNNLSSGTFMNQVSRRSGNSDPQFARLPVTAVFGALKQLVDDNTSGRVADSLSPELRELWQNA
jgi:uncharacterized protein (DUF2267 family)